MVETFKDFGFAVQTAVKGMVITLKTFFDKPVTLQYPDQRPEIDERFRGIHYLEQEKCISCKVCALACPVDCIHIESELPEKGLYDWARFDIDYGLCMFCELCCFPCPTDCIHMGKEFDFSRYSRMDLVRNMLTWEGISSAQKKEVDAIAAEKAAKKAAAADKKKAEGGDKKEG
ncbi:MAG: NADH-quinone oxidoreductase subunit I [Planctomycetota bacterium]